MVFCAGLTGSLFAVGEVWRDDDPPGLAHTHVEEPLVHAGDDVAHADVGVVGGVPLVAAHSLTVISKRDKNEKLNQRKTVC